MRRTACSCRAAAATAPPASGNSCRCWRGRRLPPESFAVLTSPYAGAAEFDAQVNVIDVDANPALETKYDELVPVLLHGDVELCHYFLDTPKVREYLAGIR